jgi:4-hydroxybenzoate polyprenyltransferase
MKTQDAPATHWSDRLPDKAQAFAQLSRLDRPIGWRLLFLPCLMGLAVVRIGEQLLPTDGAHALLFLVGAVAMRGAGCTYNDIADRRIDAAVARTAARPIPSGRVSVKEAWIWLAAQCGVGLGVLAMLPAPAQIVAVWSIPLAAAYPFMKRITWWPQAWLGLTFSWGALVAGAAGDGARIPVEAVLVYAGCVAWTIAYDTVYALQDREDDALVGVRSTARLFGARWRRATLGFYGLAIGFWLAAATAAGAGAIALVGVCAIGAFVIWPSLERVDAAQPASALRAFKRNALVGLLVAATFAVDPVYRTLVPLLAPGAEPP